MSEDRPIRDVLAEVMRRERLGNTPPSWQHWCEVDPTGGPEQWRLRADHLIRLLASEGVMITRTGDAALPPPAPTSPVFWRYHMDGNKSERVLRIAGDKIEVIRLTDGEEMVQIAFSLGEIHATASALLLGDREAAKRQGILTMLSAALEAYRLDVAVMEPAT